MVDRTSRDKLAENLRHFAAGIITNREYEDRILESRCTGDAAAEEILHQVWYYYDDLSEHRLTGSHSLTREGREIFARLTLFLKSDIEYEGPIVSIFAWCSILWIYVTGGLFIYLVSQIFSNIWLILLAVPYLGISYAVARHFIRKKNGNKEFDDSLWPFARLADYEAALINPPYLNGKLRSTGHREQ
ncbi:MAG: hypothetical protein AB9903_02510 [Vulcanimicrobiota bacterium]